MKDDQLDQMDGGRGRIFFLLLRRMRAPLIIMISVTAISMLGMVLIPGVDDHGHPYHMSFFDAFYFVTYMSTTIGFGEIPYAFTDAQRFWVALSIYPTVIAWMYTFGSILNLMQDKAFRQAVSESMYARYVRNIREPFYLVCGYGTTGRLLVRSLTNEYRQCVVIDVNQQYINEMAVDDLHMYVPGLSADASESEHLIKAGLIHPMCRAITAITDDDRVNLKIAITARLLHPSLKVVARSEHRDVTASMRALGIHRVIDPFASFAEDLGKIVQRPALYRFQHLLTEHTDPIELATRAASLRNATWILCGFGRMGQAIYESLTEIGVNLVVIDAFPDESIMPVEGVIARGTWRNTLIKAKVEHAAGLIAVTDDDADNLSIIIAARELNERIFLVARQELHTDDALFDACRPDIRMQPNLVVARKVHAWLSTPLLQDFVSDIASLSDSVVAAILRRIESRVPVNEFETWQVEINEEAYALAELMAQGIEVPLAVLLRDPWHPDEMLPHIALFARTDDSRWMLPDASLPLQMGMKLLFCGQETSAGRDVFYNREALQMLADQDASLISQLD